MSDDLANLQRLGSDIAQSIVDISTNFTIGFGSFVDKVLTPYVNLNPFRLDDPCFPDGCEAPYSYRHVITLTNDSNTFNTRVQDQVISGNQDSPEGGFDGFLQSIVCTDVIGWREISRKILLFITDAGFHMAGDGKLAGVVRPNDGTCRISGQPTMSTPVEYDDWDTQDYPSVGQIAEALREFDIIPIFAAEMSALPIYERLVEEIGVAFTGILASDSRNVVNLVTDLYNEISQRIEFDPDPVNGISFDVTPTNCPGEIIDGICTGVQIEQVANFTVGITLTECTPELMQGPLVVPVRVVGFGTFEVQINAICQCPCEEEGQQIAGPDVCNGNGTLVCGICECNEGSFGDQCQCNAAQATANQDCPLGPNNIQCTGRGTCTCGQCECDLDRNNMPLYSGLACECDLNALCSRSIRDERCTGRGACTCDGCRCNTEPNTGMPYFGEFCECTPDTDCRDPFNSTDFCNGRGVCSCAGTCECEDGPYFGQYCELCSGDPVCFDNSCSANLVCAACVADYATRINETVTPEVFFRNESLLSGNFSVLGGLLELYLNTLGVQFNTTNCSDVCASDFIALINGTDTVEYRIDGDLTSRCEYVDPNLCIYRYYVPNPLLEEGLLNNDLSIAAVDVRTLPIHVEYTGVCPFPGSSSSQGVEAWVIAISIIIPLLVLGILALLLLKLLLLLLDHIEVRKFERELARTKYTKNENPLYRSANKEYKNPIYGK